MHKAGLVFVVFACAWIGLNVHCGWVRYHEFLGNIAFNKVHLPDELALAQLDPARWLSPADRENIVQGKGHYLAASRTGLFVNNEALPKLAWFEYLLGDAAQSVQTLAHGRSLPERREQSFESLLSRRDPESSGPL